MEVCVNGCVVEVVNVNIVLVVVIGGIVGSQVGGVLYLLDIVVVVGRGIDFLLVVYGCCSVIDVYYVVNGVKSDRVVVFLVLCLYVQDVVGVVGGFVYFSVFGQGLFFYLEG